MHITPPDVTLTGAWNNLKHHRDCCHYIGPSWYTGLHQWDCCRYAPGHHQPTIRLEYGYDGVTDIMLQPLKKECSREVRRSTTRWFLWYQRVCFLTTITRYVILMICQWRLAKIQSWTFVWKPLYSQSILYGNRHPICWEMKWNYKSTR